MIEVHHNIECEEMLKKIQNTMMFLTFLHKPINLPPLEEYKQSK